MERAHLTITNMFFLTYYRCIHIWLVDISILIFDIFYYHLMTSHYYYNIVFNFEFVREMTRKET